MLSEILLFTGIGLVLYALYKWIVLNNDYFEKKGVRHLKPYFLFGNSFGLFTQRYTPPEMLSMFYNAFPNEKVVGLFDLRTPVLIMRDPDVLKQITVKDFDHFEDHRPLLEDPGEDLFGNGLLMLRGQKWRDMRSTLSPAFTGSKMRQMFELVSVCADEMAQFFVKEAKSGKRVNQEMKELFVKYTNDVVATCAFGIKVNSFQEPNNEFLETGKVLTDFTGIKAIFRFLLNRISPKLAKLLNVPIFDQRTSTFFRSMVLNNMDQREREKICRPDMLSILMKVRKGDITLDEGVEEGGQLEGFATVEESSIGTAVVKRKWSDNEIVSQCFLFFFAGFDTASTALTFISHEIAMNQEIQQKLYEEIKSTNKDLNGKHITYDVLQKMKYLDEVVCEGLRKWPPFPVMDRYCVKDYHFNDNDKLNFHIEKKQVVWMPIYSFHHDPRYFPNPDKFDPERFSDENKHNIQPNTYIPFGIGPRNCIGSRFALMELKAVLYYLILNFNLQPNEKTQIPLKLKKTPFALASEKGIHLEFKLREGL